VKPAEIMTNPIQPPKDSIQPELNKLQAKRDRIAVIIAELDTVILKIDSKK